MSDCIRTVEFAYSEWTHAEQWDKELGGISVNGYGDVDLRQDSIPFVKLAVIRRYLNERGDFNRGGGQ